MKVIGIGNAIVDVICKVPEKFLKDHSLTKSTMKLIDENEFKNLLSKLTIEETVSGGSVANSIVGLSQLGNDVGFIGKINNDNLGEKYEKGLNKEMVKFLYSKKKAQAVGVQSRYSGNFAYKSNIQNDRKQAIRKVRAGGSVVPLKKRNKYLS